jgi:hypothetical protein
MFVTVAILVYCINNYTFIVGFEIPQYNTSFGVTLTSGTYTITSSATFSPYTSQCTGPINLTTSESITITDTCSFGLLSVIYPAVPNAQVYENYALSEAVSYKKISHSFLMNCIMLLVLSNFAIMPL